MPSYLAAGRCKPVLLVLNKVKVSGAYYALLMKILHSWQQSYKSPICGSVRTMVHYVVLPLEVAYVEFQVTFSYEIATNHLIKKLPALLSHVYQSKSSLVYALNCEKYEVAHLLPWPSLG